MSQPTTSPWRPIAALLAGGVAVMVAVAWWRQSMLLLNHDVATYAHAVRSALDGGRPYVDFIQLNPPLGLLLYLPHGLAEQWLGIPWRVSNPAMAYAACGATLLWWSRLVATRASRAEVVTVGLATLFLGVWYVGYDVGQRDVYTALLTLPWLAGAGTEKRASREPGRLVAAALAALGIALKPHFLAIWAGVVLAGAARTRGLRTLWAPQNLVMGVVWVAYVAVVAIGFPEYFGDVVPLARETYGSFDRPVVVVFTRLRFLVPFLTLPAAAFLVVRIGSARATALLGATVGAALAFLAQKKGWTYQTFPFVFYLTLLWATLLSSEGMVRSHRWCSGAGLGFTVLGLLWLSEGQRATELEHVQHEDYASLRDQIRARGPGATVMPMVATLGWVPNAILAGGGRHHGPFPHYWMLPAWYRQSALESGQPMYDASRRAEEALYDLVLRDLRTRPRLLVVESETERFLWGDSDFRFLDWLANEPRIAQELANYELVGGTPRYDLYARRR